MDTFTIIEISIGLFLVILTGLLGWVGREIAKTRAAIYSTKSEIVSKIDAHILADTNYKIEMAAAIGHLKARINGKS